MASSDEYRTCQSRLPGAHSARDCIAGDSLTRDRRKQDLRVLSLMSTDTLRTKKPDRNPRDLYANARSVFNNPGSACNWITAVTINMGEYYNEDIVKMEFAVRSTQELVCRIETRTRIGG